MKYARFFAGLTILFSIFLFMGTKGHHHGCTECEGELGGIVTVVNNSFEKFYVFVIPGIGGALIYPGGTKTFYLDEGLYQVIGTTGLAIFGDFKVIFVRMVEIQIGSNKTVSY